MKTWEKLALWLLLTWGWCGCASQKSAESHADYVAEVQTVRTEGAERVTVLEFGLSPVDEVQDPRRGEQGDTDGRANPPQHVKLSAGHDDVLPPHGPLLKATITETGPITTTTKSGTEVHADAESQSSHKFGFALWPWLLLGGGLLVAGYIAWRVKPPWLGWLFKLLGKA